ncbi:MAG: phosphonate C-P lyase system protein PhnG [Tabrizicola sp.]|uniref:phosphonate C-P lyase system protein PhnG n=1 Tax=Tabrizicola sp. TaxID=2005166 RepID=UPI002ABA288F|nr:phosphonate C-P lyase system protein PhnG [Tabrizicola sp.]MDZ4085445.1 phosphonate C-P lyase system protein PhnG [Tabrizicola sp.]
MTAETPDPALPAHHARTLSVLARARPGPLKALAETLLDDLDGVEVLTNRTGLVMLPMTDPVQGTDFHLGEVLVAEAHIRTGAAEGYGMVTGRDLEQALAMAVVDAALMQGLRAGVIATFVESEAAEQAEQDRRSLCDIAATRVDMETF